MIVDIIDAYLLVKDLAVEKSTGIEPGLGKIIGDLTVSDLHYHRFIGLYILCS